MKKRIARFLSFALLLTVLLTGMISCTKNSGSLVISGDESKAVQTAATEKNGNGTFTYAVNDAGYYAITGYTPLGSNIVKVEIPETIDGIEVTSIASEAFYYCPYISEITIPQTVTKIAENAFAGCTALEKIVIPDSVTKIGDGLFVGCTSLKSVTFSSELTEIPAFTFNGCVSLESFTISDQIVKIGEGAFQGCSALTAVVIPDSVLEIGALAFYNCASLASFEVGAQLLLEKIGEYAVARCNENLVITCPEGSGMAAYKELYKNSLTGPVPETEESTTAA